MLVPLSLAILVVVINVNLESCSATKASVALLENSACTLLALYRNSSLTAVVAQAYGSLPPSQLHLPPKTCFKNLLFAAHSASLNLCRQLLQSLVGCAEQ